MAEELVMRSVYVPASEDAKLRQLAHESGYTKSDLIRAAIKLKVEEWIKSNGLELLRTDVAAGLREVSLQREIKKVKPKSVQPRVEASTAPTRAAAKPAPKGGATKRTAAKTREKKASAS